MDAIIIEEKKLEKKLDKLVRKVEGE